MNSMLKTMGQFPIWKYRYNISRAIEEDYRIKKEEHRKYVEQEKIVIPGIQYICSVLLQGPKVDIKSKKIIFSEPYLGYLWVSIYFFSMLYEKHILPQNNSKKRVFIDYSHDFNLLRASLIFRWGRGLRYRYSLWPEGFPPEKGDEEEMRWAGKTYTLWIRAVSFIFYHEFGHLFLRHSLSNGDALVEMEKDADRFACDIVIADAENENLKTEALLGVLILMLSNFFIVNSLREIKPNNHLDLRLRVENILDLVDFADESKKEYFYYFAATIINCLLDEYGVDTKSLPKEYIKAKDYWNDMCLVLEKQIPPMVVSALFRGFLFLRNIARENFTH